jgi:diphthamide biosynthesis protein 2
LYLDVIEDVKRLVAKAGKKPYLLAVGKPNPAKLGNFLDIDVFCLVACPTNAILDSREYMKPIVTPWELMLALTEQDWNADQYELDITQVSKQMKDVEVVVSDEPRFSLLTGTFATSRIHSDTEDDSDSKAITQRMTGGVMKYSGKFLSNRTYQGLDMNQQAEVKKYEVGRAGIAKGYTHEDS